MLSLLLAQHRATGLNIAGMFRIFQGLGMPLWARLTAALFIALLFIFVPAFAAPDDDFLAARDAFNARNSARLDQYANKLQEHPLAPFVRYWQLAQSRCR